MSRWLPWDVLDGAYADETRPWSSQDTVNYLLVPAEQAGTLSSKKLVGVPGYDLFCDLGTDAPVRGTYNADGTFLAVSGNTLFRVSTGGVPTSIGTIPGVGRVSMAHNKLASGGNQVAIGTGNSGYVYSTVDGSLVQITDAGFPGATTFDFADGFITFTDPFGRFWGHSELQDALNYNTLDRSSAESAPDPIVGHIVSHGEVCVFGTRTGEFYRNTGAATGTFQATKGAETEVGLASPYAVVRLDNTVYWLGSDGLVYRYNGHTPEIVSNGPIAAMVSGLNLANAFAFTWEDRKHKVVYFTFPDGPTIGFDVWTGRYHRRESYGMSRWRINTLTRFQRSDWIAGDFQNGRLYKLNWNSMREYDQPLVSRRIFSVASDSGNALIINGVKLAFDTGKLGGDPLRLSGDLPNGEFGDSVSTSYIANGGVPPFVNYQVVSGALPAGVTLNSSTGVASGAFADVGSFSWVVQVTDSVGQTAQIADSVKVFNIEWWLTNVDPPGVTNAIWVSEDVTSWASSVLRTRGPAPVAPNAGVWGGGYNQLSESQAAFVNTAGVFETTNDLNAGDNLVVEDIVIPGASSTMKLVNGGDGVLVVTSRSGSAQAYYTSADAGQTWTQRPSPLPGAVPQTVAKMGSRWVMSCNTGSTRGMFYSDDAGEPINWLPGTGDFFSQDGMIVLASSDVGLAIQDTLVIRSVNGVNWTSTPHGVAGLNGICGDHNGDTFIFGDPNGSVLLRTADRGLTWQSIPFRNTQRISYYAGVWVASCPGNVGGIFYSLDDGITWQEVSSYPPGIAPDFNVAMYVNRVRYLP